MPQKTSDFTGFQPLGKALPNSTGHQLSKDGSDAESNGAITDREESVARMQAVDLTTLTDLSRRCMRRQTQLSIETQENGWTRRTATLTVPEAEARKSLSRLRVLTELAEPQQVSNLIALLAAIYPVTKRSENQAAAASYWISIFTKQPIGAVLLGFDDYIRSEERFFPTPGAVLAKVEPYSKRISHKINMLEAALDNRPIDRVTKMPKSEQVQWKRLQQKGRLMQKEIDAHFDEKARAAERTAANENTEWTDEKIKERRDSMKAKLKAGDPA